MQQRIQLITLGASDIAASRRFYVDGLGWTPMMEMDDVLFFQVGPGLVLSLFDNEHLAADTGFADAEVAAAQQPTRMTIGYNPTSEAEVDEAMRRAETAGGTVLKPAQRAFWGGYHGFVADPDGFTWEIAYNPGLVFGDDGVARFTDG